MALLHLPPSVKPESLLGLMPAEGSGDLASIADKYMKDAEALDLDALGRTLFEQGLPAEFKDQAGSSQYPRLAADMIAQRMSSRGFTPIAAIGMFKGQWVSGAFLEAPHPEDIQAALTNVLDDALRRELERARLAEIPRPSAPCADGLGRGQDARGGVGAPARDLGPPGGSRARSSACVRT